MRHFWQYELVKNILTGNVHGVVGEVAAPWFAAKLMTSPKFVRWLASASNARPTAQNFASVMNKAFSQLDAAMANEGFDMKRAADDYKRSVAEAAARRRLLYGY